MNIVTVFNYPDEVKYNIMCCTWIRQVRKYSDNKIIILTENSVSKTILNFVKNTNLENVEFRILSRNKTINFQGHPDFVKADHNVNFKLFNLCKMKESYIFIDADAFLLKEIDDLKKAALEKPLIAVNHQIIPGQTDMLPEPVLNSGVMVVSDPKFLNWEKLISILHRDRRFVWPGTDQSLINSLCKESKYDYTHPKVGYEWNSWSAYTVWENNNAYCRGLSVEHNVFINHYWNQYKPWNTNCHLYQETKRILEEKNDT